MTDKFQGKYRIPSARLQHWDYANDGAYFITICTHDKIHHFGECKNGKMKLSTMGAIVQGFWYEIPKHFAHVILGEFTVMPNHIHGIVMLDWNLVGGRQTLVETLHCNVSIPEENTTKSDEQALNDNQVLQSDSDQTLQSDSDQTLQSDSDQTLQSDSNQTLQSDSDQTLQSDSDQTLQSDSNQTLQCNVSTKHEFFRKISPKSGSISTIMRSYKSICSQHIHQVFPDVNFEWQERFWDNIIRSEESYKNIENYILNNPTTWENDKFY
jgi:putative transposase